MKCKFTDRLIVTFVLSAVFMLLSCGNQSKTIFLKDYITSDIKDDVMPAIRNAIKDCNRLKANKLVLPSGHLQVKPDFAFERYCFVTNNDEGLKRIAFDLSGMENIEIQGDDTHLDFVGYVVPFLLNYSNNVVIDGVSIDYTTPFHSEAEIINVKDDFVDLKFDKDEFPYEIRNGLLCFANKPTGHGFYNSMLEFDKQKREPAHDAVDYWADGAVKAADLGNDCVRMFYDGMKATPGNILVFGCGHRLIPAFIISDCRNVLINNTNVFHSGGMAFVAQRSMDIELNKCKVTPAPDKNRVLSATADATHFANCGGYVKLTDCLFENQFDDATNIHGIYCKITDVVYPDKLIVKLKHEAQHGFYFFKKGLNVEIVNNQSLEHIEDAVVEEVRIINKEYQEIVLKEPLSAFVERGFVVAQTSYYPEVTIKGCTVRSNRARGLLLGSRAKIVIDSNYFHVPGSPVYFEGDGSYWFEQSGVRDVEITRNTFDNCGFGSPSWGKATIAVGSGIWKDNENCRYHKNIRVHDNVFRHFNPRIVNIYCVDGFVFYDNILIETDDYQYNQREKRPFITNNCDNINIK